MKIPIRAREDPESGSTNLIGVDGAEGITVVGCKLVTNPGIVAAIGVCPFGLGIEDCL